MSSSMLFALILFIITYALMFALDRYRPHIAVGSAVLYVLVGSLHFFPDFRYTFLNAALEIDWNVLLMIAGTMGSVWLFIDSGMPKLMSDVLVSRVHTFKWLVVILSLFAGLVSAFVDNVATVLMIAPVALAICKKINVSPVPAIICIAVSSNLQGAATLVGDTTSILLGKAAGLDFTDFFFCSGKPGMFFVTEAGALAATVVILIMMRKEKHRFALNDRTPVEDKVPAILLLLTILTLIGVSFIPYRENAAPGQLYKPDISNGVICCAYFLIGAVRSAVKDKNLNRFESALKSLDYFTIILLAGLFVIIGAIREAGIIDLLGNLISGLSGDGSRGSLFLVYSVIVWMSVILSAFIDNIPYTATMLPVVAVIASNISSKGTAVDPRLLYFGLLVGATLGGNLTPIGASANITGLGILRREGYEVSSGEFMKYGVPFTLAAVVTGWLLIWVIWA